MRHLDRRCGLLLALVAALCTACDDEGDRFGDAGPGAELGVGEIAAVVDAINDRQIAEATLAPARASSAEVLELADDIRDDHAEVREEQDEILEVLRVTRAGTDLSRIIDADTQAAVVRLASSTGPAFDRAYLEAVILQHREAIRILNSIEPTVAEGDFLSFLEGFRGMEITHLNSAMLVEAELVARRGRGID